MGRLSRSLQWLSKFSLAELNSWRAHQIRVCFRRRCAWSNCDNSFLSHRNSHHTETSRCLSEGICAPIPLGLATLCTSQYSLKHANAFLTCSRGGASGNKLKMTLGLPVYVLETFTKTRYTARFWSTFSSLTLAVLQWCSNVLRRQLRCSKSLHHLSQGYRRSPEPATSRWCGRYGYGYSEEGKA
jgi:hypothetical protein